MAEEVVCEICGHPMPKGEEAFTFHGYSGPCPTELSSVVSSPVDPSPFGSLSEAGFFKPHK